MKWFLSLYINWLPTETTLRVFDAFFCEGCTVLQRIGLAILKMHQNQLLATKTAEEATALLSELPRYLYDADSLIKLAFSSDLGSFKEEKLTQRRFDAQRAIQDKQHLSSFGMLRNLFEGYGEKALRQLADHLLTRMKHASKSPHPPVSGRKLDYSTFLYAMWDVDSKLDDKHVQLLWKVFDPKSKNLVNYFDIIAGLSLIFSGIPLAKLRVCFDCFDMDKDGFLDTREIFSCALVHYKWLVRSLATLTWDVDSQVRAEVENMWKKVRPLLDEKTTGRMNFVQFRFKVVRELKEAEQWLTIGDQLFDMQTLTPLVHSAAELVKDSELGATSSRQSSQTGKNESEELGPMGTGGATGNEDGVHQRGKPNKAGGTQGGAGLDDEEDGAWKWEIIIKDRSLDEDDQSRIINEKGEVEHVVKVPKILHSFNVNLMANNNHHHHHHHHYGGSMIGMSNNSGTSGEMGYSHSPGSVASELSHHSWSDGEEKEKEKKKKRSIFKPRKKISASSGGLAQQHFSSTGGAGRIPPYRSPRGERTASAADAPYSSLAAAAVAAEALSFSLASSNATVSPSPSSSSATYNSHNFTTTNSTSRQSSPIVPHSSDSYSGSEEEPQHSRAKKERRREGGGGAAATSRDNKQVALDDLASLQQRFNPERENTDGGASSESDSEPTTNVAYRAAGGAQQQGKGNNMKTKVQNLKKAVKKTGNYMASGYNKATSKSSTVPTTISPSQELLKKRSGSEPPLVDPKVCGSPTSTHQQSPPTTASPPWPNKMPPQQQHEDGSFVPSSTQAAD
ncbi:GTPase activating protein (GAP), variant 2 [Balamuthia mandrillaris]